jgi:hypothetical protein
MIMCRSWLLLIVAVLTACGSSSTPTSSTAVDGARPSFDGIGYEGSGGRTADTTVTPPPPSGTGG